MYTPARSDLVALALAAIGAVSLLVVVESSDSAAVVVPAFIAIPFTPLLAAWLSGPPHSMASRFLQRGVAAIAGMAAAIVVVAATSGASYDSGRTLAVLGGIMWASAFATFAFVMILATAVLLRPRDHEPQRPGN